MARSGAVSLDNRQWLVSNLRRPDESRVSWSYGMRVLPVRNVLHTGQADVGIDVYSSRLPPVHPDDRQWLPVSLMPRVGAFRPAETVRSTARSHAPPDRRCPSDSTDATCACGQPCCR